MHSLLEILLVVVYFVPAAMLLLFALNLYFMLCMFMRRRHRARREVEAIGKEFAARFSEADLPSVVTQIPLYNEYNVAERAIRAAVAMTYPAGRHTVQVLDDSTDETRRLVDQVVAELRAEGHAVEVVRRRERVGFKAGALDFGMRQTEAEFFAILDADFVAPKDFLMRTMPVMLVRPSVGIVQARWGHLNDTHSLVTKAQGVGIDGHFTVEQPARAWNNLFMNFNGTAGLWRREAIDAAGGWEHDTLTEDMDLSYRSQLAGWRPFFMADLVVPAELPDNINAFKSQQFRWAKGSIQTAIKLLPRVFRSRVSLLAKAQAFFHMTHYMIHPIMLWLALMALPLLVLTDFTYSRPMFFGLFFLFVVSTLAPTVLYATSQCYLYESGWRRLKLLPFLTSLGIGIAISNTRAVLEACLRRESPFVRTPKRGEQGQVAYTVRMPYLAIFELMLGAYCFYSLGYYLHTQRFVMGPFLLLYACGFTIVGVLSLLHNAAQVRWLRARAHA
jgi:cellulose synthase/poly-beta-1,6-N-acetylglucosamine synthase-like glycosyltransferase